MTLLEVCVVVFALLVVAGMILPRLGSTHRRGSRAQCINNLKQLGTAYQMWLHDFEDRAPSQVPPAEGGARGATQVSQRFMVLSNYIPSTKIVTCPGFSKWRQPALSWSQLTDRNVSYAIGGDGPGLLRMDASSGNRAGGSQFEGLGFYISDMDIEGGLLVDSRPNESRVFEFAADDRRQPSSRVSWSKTNHVDVGEMSLVDGTVVAVDNAGLRRLFSLWLGAGTDTRWMVPR